MTSAHKQTHSFQEVINYPDHVDRTASALFEHNRKILVDERNLGCWICDSKDHREVHHLHEWSLWDVLDPVKVLDNLKIFDFYGYVKDMGDVEITSPDDIRNLVVLCGHCLIEGENVPGGHHRGLEAGVHDLTLPIWLAQRAVKPGFSITKAIQHAKSVDASLAGKPQGS